MKTAELAVKMRVALEREVRKSGVCVCPCVSMGARVRGGGGGS